MNTGSAVVDSISTVSFRGNITPASWYKHIRFPADKHGICKPDTISVTLLSEIVYWYRPYDTVDENTGATIWHRKFYGDKLRMSQAMFSEKFGFSRRQVAESLHRLETLGLITLELRNEMLGQTFCNNVQYIEPCVDRVKEITFDAPPSPPEHDPITPNVPASHADGITYSKTSPKTTTKTSKEKPVGAVAPDLDPPQKAAHQDMIAAICEVTGQDLTLSSIRGQILRTSKELREGGITAADVRTVFAKGGWWYRDFWKGVKGEKPSIRDVVAQVRAGLADHVVDDTDAWLAEARLNGQVVL